MCFYYYHIFVFVTLCIIVDIKYLFEYSCSNCHCADFAVPYLQSILYLNEFKKQILIKYLIIRIFSSENVSPHLHLNRNIAMATKASASNYLTPKLDQLYTEFGLIPSNKDLEKDYLKTYHAKLKSTGEPHVIKIIDTSSRATKEESDENITIFIQEMLHLCQSTKDALIIEHTEFYQDRIAFVFKYFEPLSKFLEKNPIQNDITSLESEIERLISGVVTDLQFIHTNLQNENLQQIDLDSINRFEESGAFFLENWSGIFLFFVDCFHITY